MLEEGRDELVAEIIDAQRFDIHGQPTSGMRRFITPEEADAIANGGLADAAHFENPFTQNGTTKTSSEVARKARRAIVDEVHTTAPPAATADRISSLLMRLLDDAQRSELGAPTAQRIVGRMAADTGVLTGTAAGAIFGGRAGRTLGALAGGIFGLAIPEILASRTDFCGTFAQSRSSCVATAGTGIGANSLRRQSQDKGR